MAALDPGTAERRAGLGRAALPLAWQRPPAVPELELQLLAPELDVAREAPNPGVEEPPFWAFAWASGQVLARYLLDRPGLVRARRVLDLGAGCGIAAIAAARAGAASVLATDLDPEARRRAARNARRNGASIRVAAVADPAAFDLVLASDVAYEAGAVELLRAAAAAGRPVLLADPERNGPLGLPVEERWRRRARTWPELDEPMPGAAVFRWRATPQARVAR